MKKILLLSMLFVPRIANSCPTCVGKVTSTTLPFFAEEFYRPGKGNNTPGISATEYGKKELQKLIDESKGKK